MIISDSGNHGWEAMKGSSGFTVLLESYSTPTTPKTEKEPFKFPRDYDVVQAHVSLTQQSECILAEHFDCVGVDSYGETFYDFEDGFLMKNNYWLKNVAPEDDRPVKWSLKTPCTSEPLMVEALAWKEENDIEKILTIIEGACKELGRDDILEEFAAYQDKYTAMQIIDLMPDEGVVTFDVYRRVYKTKNTGTLSDGPQFYVIVDDVEAMTTTAEPARFTSAAIRILRSKDFSDEQHIRQLSAAAKYIRAEYAPGSSKITRFLQMEKSGQLKPCLSLFIAQDK